ncbi:MAG TPA: BrxA/BrxB family bacilliredoxin, partial [Candidatus Binatia bacterium]|nr:BrxA/BrxB family bacilliredoxin [Candidatus Binatia bacterium]
MYPEEFVKPMREELTRVGFRELRTAQEVDSALKEQSGTVLVVVNSICGCAAGKAR